MGGNGRASLRDLFVGRHVGTTYGRSQWLSLVPDLGYQMNCNREGFVVNAGSSGGSGQSTRCRLGLLMGDQEDCSAPGSVIGIGCEGDVLEVRPAMGMEENGTNQMEFFEVTAGGRAANGDEWPLDVE